MLRLALLAGLILAAPARADTLVDNCDGTAIDARGNAVHFTGLLIAADGRITQVLHGGDKRPTRVDYAVDEHGRTTIPGFVDAHAQVMPLGFATLTLDLTNAASLAEVQGRVAAYTAAHPDRGWIIGRGWDNARLPQTLLSAATLDLAAGDHPVWLVSADGHAGWANSRALALAHISALTRDPPGGRIMRGIGGRPSGVLVDGAMALVASLIPAPRPEDRDLAFANAQAQLLKRGITTVTDMGTTIEDWQTYRRAGDSGALAIRILAYADGVEAMALIGGPGPTPFLYDDRLRLSGVSLALDGSLSQHSALLRAPYADDPGDTGLARLSETQLKNLMSRAAIDHFQVAIHAAGDAALAEALSAIADLSDTYGGDRRWRIEDNQALDPADLPRLASHGVVLAMLPGDLATLHGIAEARLGLTREPFAFAWHSVASHGAVLAFGSGAPDHVSDPLGDLAAAITRQDQAGEPPGGWQPQEKLDREAALGAMTANPAFAGFADGRFGRIEVGQRADFLILDHDPLLASPSELRTTRILEVWIGGRKVQG